MLIASEMATLPKVATVISDDIRTRTLFPRPRVLGQRPRRVLLVGL